MDQTAKLDDLEAHVAHQDGTVQDLSDVVLRQWDTIKSLGEKLERIETRLRDLENEISAGPPEEEPPPHY